MSDNLYLFANNNGGQAENNGSYRLYDMKIEGDSAGVESGVKYVDCLIPDGESWINTGIPVATNYRIDVTFMTTKTNYHQHNGTNYYCIYGSANPMYYGYDNLKGTTVGLTDATISVRDNGSGGTFAYVNYPIDSNCYNKKYTLSRRLVNVTNSLPIYLFANNTAYNTANNNNVYDKCDNTVRIYDYKVYNIEDNLLIHLRPCLDTQRVPCMYDEVSKKYFYNQGTGRFKYKKTLRDFQPVLDSNNTPCLLDKINNKFYYNKGTGSFTYGGIQTPKDGYTEIEYIESNGTQYIDTGVVPNSNTDIDMTCRAVSNGGYILNKLQLDTTYKFNGTDTTAQPNLTASAGATLTMGSSNIALLTEAEIAQAVLNGWTIQ